MNSSILEKIDRVLAERKSAGAEQSYVAALYQNGTAAIVSKIREEAEETCEAAYEEDDPHLVHEVADLLFHCHVLLAHRDIPVGEVLKELERRFGVSGHKEKSKRAPIKPEANKKP